MLSTWAAINRYIDDYGTLGMALFKRKTEIVLDRKTIQEVGRKVSMVVRVREAQ